MASPILLPTSTCSSCDTWINSSRVQNPLLVYVGENFVHRSTAFLNLPRHKWKMLPINSFQLHHLDQLKHDVALTV